MSRSALGTTWVTSEAPSASMSPSMGPMTVVFPAPMIIWWTDEILPRAAERNWPTSSTWRLRSINPTQNSKTRNRGSNELSGRT